MSDIQQEITNKILLVKLKRIQELNSKLIEALNRERIPASKACSIYTQDTPDYLVPSVWNLNPEQNRFQRYERYKSFKLASSHNSCCSIM